MSTSTTIRTDATAWSVVSVCACGWRFAGQSHGQNSRAIREHVHVAHGDDQAAKKRADDAARMARKRESQNCTR